MVSVRVGQGLGFGKLSLHDSHASHRSARQRPRRTYTLRSRPPKHRRRCVVMSPPPISIPPRREEGYGKHGAGRSCEGDGNNVKPEKVWETLGVGIGRCTRGRRCRTRSTRRRTSGSGASAFSRRSVPPPPPPPPPRPPRSLTWVSERPASAAHAVVQRARGVVVSVPVPVRERGTYAAGLWTASPRCITCATCCRTSRYMATTLL